MSTSKPMSPKGGMPRGSNGMPAGKGGTPPGKFGKPKNVGKTVGRLLSYVAKSKGLMAIVIFLVLFSSVANIAGTYFLTPIINEIGNLLNTGSADMSLLVKLIVLLGIIYALGAAAQYAYSRLMLNVSQKTLNLLRQDLFDHLMELPIR